MVIEGSSGERSVKQLDRREWAAVAIDCIAGAWAGKRDGLASLLRRTAVG